MKFLLNSTRSFSFRQAMLLTAGCFALIALGVIAVTFVSSHYARQGAHQTETLTGQFLPGVVGLARLQDATLDLKSITYQFALAKGEAEMNVQKEAFQTRSAQVTSSVADLKLLAHDEPTQRLIADFAADVEIYRAKSEQFQSELGAGEFEKAMATLDQQIGPAQQKIESRLRALSERYFQLSHDASARTTALLAQSKHFGLVGTIVLAGFVLLCLALSLAATRALLAQMEIRDAERQAAQDTLEKRVDERTRELSAEIVERQRAEETLRLLSSAVEQSKESILITEADLDPPGPRIIFANRAFTEMTGFTVAEALGQTPRILQGPRTDRAVLDRLRRNLEQGEVFSGEAINYRKDRTPYDQEWQIAPLRDASGKITHFVAIMRDITARKRAEADLEAANKEWIDLSRQAGMAEVATSVLHNVGNVLNSVNVSATLVFESVKKSKASGLLRVVALLDQHAANLGAFIGGDPQGRKLPAFLRQLSEQLTREQQTTITELQSLRENIEHIKDIVAMQQSYARVSGVVEVLQITDLIEDSLRMNGSALTRHGCRVVREYQEVPPIRVEKHKVLQILVNLIRNAKYACDEAGGEDKRITLRVEPSTETLRISVIDNGIGIPVENRTRIFNHGFTTRKDGHGFGLHSGALAAAELGGSLSAHSDGPMKGATFTLELPLIASSTS